MCEEHPCPLSPDLFLWGRWRFLTWVWHHDPNFCMVTGLCVTHDPKFGSLFSFWRCKEHPCPLSPDLWLWRLLEVPEWGLVSWSWFGYGHWSLIYPCSEFWLSILILKVQRTSMSFKSSFGAFEDPGGSWLGFGIFIKILTLYTDFEGAKNLHVP